jgi:hypothetical protein
VVAASGGRAPACSDRVISTPALDAFSSARGFSTRTVRAGTAHDVRHSYNTAPSSPPVSTRAMAACQAIHRLGGVWGAHLRNAFGETLNRLVLGRLGKVSDQLGHVRVVEREPHVVGGACTPHVAVVSHAVAVPQTGKGHDRRRWCRGTSAG